MRNQNGGHPGAWHTRSIRQPEAAAQGLPFFRERLDNLDEAGWALGMLEAYPLDTIERLLARGHPLAWETERSGA
jgi:hypothetical protein